MLAFEDKIMIKICGNVKAGRLLEGYFVTKNQRIGSLNNLLQKLQRTAHCRKWLAVHVLFLFYQ